MHLTDKKEREEDRKKFRKEREEDRKELRKEREEAKKEILNKLDSIITRDTARPRGGRY